MSYDPIVSKLRNYTLKTKDWGDLLLMSPKSLSDEDPWGVLAPIKETPWGALIPEISRESYNLAVYGFGSPLVEELGVSPKLRSRKLGREVSFCMNQQNASCILAGEHCVPSSGTLPDCYEAPFENKDLSFLLSLVGLAWNSGRYVAVIISGV